MWRVRSLTWFHLGRRGSPRGFWLVRATPRWSLLEEGGQFWSTCPSASSPQIKTTFACLFRKRTIKMDSFTLTSTLGYLSTPLRNPLRISVSSRSRSAPNFWRFSDWRKWLLQLNRRLGHQSSIKAATVEFPRLRNVCRQTNLLRLFNDICVCCDLEACGGVFNGGTSSSVCRVGPDPQPQRSPLDAELPFSHRDLTGKLSGYLSPRSVGKTEKKESSNARKPTESLEIQARTW